LEIITTPTKLPAESKAVTSTKGATMHSQQKELEIIAIQPQTSYLLLLLKQKLLLPPKAGKSQIREGYHNTLQRKESVLR
jgi:hypothetical protein